MITLRTFYSSPENKHTLVLLHAFPLSSAMWDSAAAVISTNAPAFNILLVDFPGFGNPEPEKQWTLGEAMVELHDQLNSTGIVDPVLGGLSMGGYAAFAYYRLYQNEVKALILSNTKADADTDEGKKGREEFALDAEARGAQAVYDRLLDKLVSASSKKNDPALVPKLKEWISSFTAKSFAMCLRALALRFDSSDLLPTISCPTLVITGDDDAIIPHEDMEAMAAKIKSAKFVSFTKSGHLTAVEYPEKWGVVVSSFLNVI
ncbi:MAG: alpha/beta hydrolase [Bacteroidota bacterium]|nr:alpha/beta hydrolase [Bacteroidota bacterium]MDP4231637.1 alpha/beta hydrolase [Bacteroidota bacterium]MDP4236004.1 alpha/beta hydrolase [Bacteroidota bacterium]